MSDPLRTSSKRSHVMSDDAMKGRPEKSPRLESDDKLIWYFLVGKGASKIPFDPNNDIVDVKETIIDRAKLNISDVDLALYKIDWTERQCREWKVGQTLPDELESMTKVEAIWPNGPPDGIIHVLAVPSAASPVVKTKGHSRPLDSTEDDQDGTPTKKLKGPEQRDISSSLLERWAGLHASEPLPAADDLARYLDQPLPQDLKIPVSDASLDDLASPGVIDDRVDEADLETIFRAGSTESANNLFHIFATAILLSSPTEGTEASFHSFWDANIRWPLRLLQHEGHAIRDSSHNTSTKNLRPDFGWVLRNICAFRGEEKAPGSKDNPREELTSKLMWTYDPLHYILGYYAIGSHVTIVAICRPTSKTGDATVRDIVTVDLSRRRNRILNLRRIIRLAGLCDRLARLVPSPLHGDFLSITRGHKTIEILKDCVKKVYTSEDRAAIFERTKQIHEKLEKKGVPNREFIVLFHDETREVYFKPRGRSNRPTSPDQLYRLIICVLETLKVLHSDPPIYHRDIRWDNIVQSYDNPSNWIVIDWEDAALPPTRAVKHFSHKHHCPALFKDNHGPEVDIWAVGDLLVDATTFLLGLSTAVLTLGTTLMERSEELGAVEAFELLEAAAPDFGIQVATTSEIPL